MEEWYQRHYGALFRYCLALAGEVYTAEDLVQETFLRALTHWDQVEELPPEKQGAWLKRTARNLLIDRVRKLSREVAAEEESLALMGAEEDFSGPAVEELLDTLPREEQALFRMRYLEGYNATELGELFNLPPGTVRSKLSDARKKIAKQLFL